MATVERAELPLESLLHAYVRPGDHLDSYACRSVLNVDDAAERALEFPPWVTALLRMRNLLVAPLGLIVRPGGERHGIFPLDQRGENELILGFDDRHLDFRVSILVDGKCAFGSTWVHAHNLAGRAYLGAVLPFHVVIMRQAVARMAT